MIVLGLCCCVQAFSSCNAMQGLLIAAAFHCRAGALGAQASVAVVYGLSCSKECGIFHGTRIEPMSPELAGRFSTYWTTREVWYF